MTLLQRQLTDSFALAWGDIVKTTVLVFADFAVPGADPKVFDQVTDLVKLEKTFEEYLGKDIRIKCEAKPCCRYCSAVLGLLGIRRWNRHTEKTWKTMGSTQWAITPNMRKFVALYTNVNPDVIEGIGK